ncbi:MAG: helix-turn-helix transcriptional regulator [Pseudomonadales bacterium]|nr:helix-turn-helix transcriptional regulator [Pseudomonadales bacterium]
MRLAGNVRQRRLARELTQQGLAERSGVPLPTLRKFEQKGQIALESFLKLLMVLGGLEEVIKATQAQSSEFTSIDEVLSAKQTPQRQRGRRK